MSYGYDYREDTFVSRRKIIGGIAIAVLLAMTACSSAGPKLPKYKGQEHTQEFIRTTMTMALDNTTGLHAQQRKLPEFVAVPTGKTEDCNEAFKVGDKSSGYVAIGFCSQLNGKATVIFSAGHLADIAKNDGPEYVQDAVLLTTQGMITSTMAEPDQRYASDSPCVHGLMAHGFDKANIQTDWIGPYRPFVGNEDWMDKYKWARDKGRCHKD